MNKIKKAFTLAEVLVTVALIGVVSLIAIRAVVVGTDRIMTESTLKDTYANLDKAFQMGVVRHGRLTAQKVGHGGSADVFATHLKPYLKIKKMCHNAAGSIDPRICDYEYHTDPNTKTTGIWKKHQVNITKYVDVYVSGGNTRRAMFELENGAIVLIMPYVCDGGGACYNETEIIVDIDGSKGKNLFARDVFKFGIDWNSNKIFPFHYNQEVGKPTTNGMSSYWGNEQECKLIGYDCSAWIAKSGWKIPKDYPSWTGL